MFGITYLLSRNEFVRSTALGEQVPGSLRNRHGASIT